MNELRKFINFLAEYTFVDSRLSWLNLVRDTVFIAIFLITIPFRVLNYFCLSCLPEIIKKIYFKYTELFWIAIVIIIYFLIMRKIIFYNDSFQIFSKLKPEDLKHSEWISYYFQKQELLTKVFTGLAVLIGIILGYNRLIVSKEEQLTNRYTKAMELLGHDNIGVRIGAIYALERISKDSSKDYASIIETISTYIKYRGSHTLGDNSDEIYAAIRVLSRRLDPACHVDFSNVDFSNVSLHRLNHTFENINFSNCNFYNAKLSKVKFKNCILQDINLTNSSLFKAEFIQCFMQRTNFHNSRLQAAYFESTDLAHSLNYTECQFKGSIFGENCVPPSGNLPFKPVRGSLEKDCTNWISKPIQEEYNYEI